jgi:hypothetical protein
VTSRCTSPTDGGMSPREYSPDHSIQKELEDLGSLLAQTGAHFVFGLSSGAVIALEASRVLSSIHKAALYEPPFYLQGMSHDLVARFNHEVGQGKLAAALVTASKIVRLGPALLKLIPRPLLELATSRVLRSEEKKGTGKYAPMRELLPAMRYDFKVVSEMDRKAESFKTVKAEILLLRRHQKPDVSEECSRCSRNDPPEGPAGGVKRSRSFWLLEL